LDPRWRRHAPASNAAGRQAGVERPCLPHATRADRQPRTWRLFFVRARPGAAAPSSFPYSWPISHRRACLLRLIG